MEKESSQDLPIIRIAAEREIPYVEWDLQMEDDTYAMLVKWGKKDATDDDYVNIAVREGLKAFVESKEDKSDEDNNK